MGFKRFVKKVAKIPVKVATYPLRVEGKLVYKTVKGITGSTKLAGAAATPFTVTLKTLEKPAGRKFNPGQYDSRLNDPRQSRLFMEGTRAGEVGGAIAASLVGAYFAAPALAGAGGAASGTAGTGAASVGVAEAGTSIVAGTGAMEAAAGGGMFAAEAAAGTMVADVGIVGSGGFAGGLAAEGGALSGLFSGAATYAGKSALALGTSIGSAKLKQLGNDWIGGENPMPMQDAAPKPSGGISSWLLVGGIMVAGIFGIMLIGGKGK